MFKRLKLSDTKEVILKAYNTELERDILIYTLSDEIDLDGLFQTLSNNIQYINCDYNSLNLDEKLLILYNIRSISIGEVFEIRCKCPKCGEINELGINVSEIYTKSNLAPDFKGYKLNNIIESSDDISKFVDFDPELLETKDYDELKDYINKNKSKIDYIHSKFCHNPQCQCNLKINLRDINLAVSSLSEDSLTTFYTSINKLVYVGGYDLSGLYKAYPYERSMYIGLLQKEIKAEQDRKNSNKSLL
jgi:hypothetical protein